MSFNIEVEIIYDHNHPENRLESQVLIMGWEQFEQFMEMVCEKQGEADYHRSLGHNWHEIVWLNQQVHRVFWNEEAV